MNVPKVLVSRKLLEELAKGKVKPPGEERLKFGRWVLKEKVGVFVGRTGEAEGKGEDFREV